MVKRCAVAMGLFFGASKTDPNPENLYVSPNAFVGPWVLYNPLIDDAQAMALVKKFRLDIVRCDDGEFMVTWGEKLGNFVKSPDLNRAIVECVANMGERT